jgi:pimeloyl-ACP methyl ester carboxylesterase
MPFLQRPDGCRLYYEVHGHPDRPAVVLLEGLGGDVPGWRRNIPTLSTRYRVVAFDFRGNGRSDKPDRPMTMSTVVDDTVALMDHLGVDAAHVYGQSFGGMVAQELALTHPGRVRSLVIAATSPGPRHAARPGPASSVPKDRPYLALYSDAFAREHPDHVAEDILVGSQNPQPRQAGRRQWEAMQGFDSFDRLSSLRVPTLVLHGTDDRLVPVENAHLLAGRIPGAQLRLLAGAGHVFHSERAEEADGAVLGFLDDVEAGAGR